MRRDMSSKHLKVCITGATGQIGYTLILSIANGSVFGTDTTLTLSLLAIPERMTALEGIKLELEDCPLPLVKEIIITDQDTVAFKNIDIAILVGSWPRTENMTRKDLLERNVNIFKSQGMALDKYAKKTCKVLVVGNPANTNCFVASKYAPSIPKENFSALTRLDHNRAKGQVALKLGVCSDKVRNVTIWGNHSSTQFPDIRETQVTLNNGSTVNLLKEINDEHWMKHEFIPCIQQRGAAVIALRKKSSAMSAAKAICDHLKSWLFGTPDDDWVSMAVFSDGSYGIDNNLVFSFPVRIDGNKNWTIVKDLEINDWARGLLDLTERELIEERNEALMYTRDF